MVDTRLTIQSSAFVTPTVCRMTLAGVFPPVQPGQFVHVAVPGFTLRRPFCITAYTSATVDVIFALVGDGTRALAALPVGTELDCILPIGNGFAVPAGARRALIIGGGLGVAPLLPVLQANPDLTFKVLLGFGSAAQAVEVDDFRRYTDDVTVATDDGSMGHKGRVTELVAGAVRDFAPDVVFCCGPTPMIRAAQSFEYGCPAYVSMEARMGCGVGACLVCTCPVEHGEVVRNLRVCIDGPVFPLHDVKL